VAGPVALALQLRSAMRATVTLLLASSLVACAVDGDDTQGGSGKADGNGSCTVPEYGDGTCHIDIACDVPDIDCYMTFDTDEAAAAWLQTQMPFTGVPSTDPRTVRARALMDRTFDLFKSRVQLGALADKRLSVVVLEGEPNAFIIDDYMTHKGAWSVQITTGELDGHLTDDQVVGVLAHELTHLAKLHFIQEVDDRMRKFYVAPEGKEPIGEMATELPTAKRQGEAWRKSGMLVGPFANPEFGDFPLAGDLGRIFAEYTTYYSPSRCPTQAAAFNATYDTLARSISRLDYSVRVDATMEPQLRGTLDALLQCAVGDPQTLRGYLSQSPEWLPYLEPQLTPDEIAQLDKPILQAIVTIINGRRRQMRTAQETFAMESGRPWSALRFYSYEEQADDNAVRIMKSADLDAAAIVKSEFLFYLEGEAAACEQALSSGSVPYGVNYVDEHHGDCWRIAHAAQMAASQPTARVLELDAEPRVPHEPRHAPRRPGANPIY
jgi:hypothetical protein